MKNIQYIFSGETEKELIENLKKINKETVKYDRCDFISPKLGTIVIPKEFETTWLGKLSIFCGWRIVFSGLFLKDTIH